jgi:hypothetical protein
MNLTLDLNEALRLYGMDAKTVSVVKAHSWNVFGVAQEEAW